MGGDYDQDMWGHYRVHKISGNTITITTDAVAASTANGQGFGYILSGTNKDGAHFHSGIYDFDYTDPTGVTGCHNCVVSNPPTSVSYTIVGSSSGVLKDPLWYAAKYGGFIDSNNNKLPDLTPPTEWDAMNNSDGTPGSDGLPDDYFYATNPLQLENSLNRVFLTILQRASSGTAAAVVSNNVSGVGALYQAYYEPSFQDASNNKVTWIGTVQALWLDDYGYLREDNGNAVLDDYITDPVIDQYYDEGDNKAKIKRYVSTRTDHYSPYYMKGKVTAYDTATKAVTFEVNEISGTVGSGPYNSWTIYNLTTGKEGTSTTSTHIDAVSATKSFTISSPTFSVGNTIMVAHFESTVVDFSQVKTLWNARKQLSFNLAADATAQRTFSWKADDSLNGGRYIKTWIDSNGNGVVDNGGIHSFCKFRNHLF